MMEFKEPKDRLIVALPLGDAFPAGLANQLAEVAGGLKVRPKHFMRYGPDPIRSLTKITRVFLDLKSHDIPNEVGVDCLEATRLGAKFVTVHAGNTVAALKMAREGSRAIDMDKLPVILGVTVLTSEDPENIKREFRALAYRDDVPAPSIQTSLISERCDKALEANLDGVVVPPWAIRYIRAKFPELFIVSAGIRFDGDPDHDHQQTANPYRVIKDGADCIVMGRSITGRDDPIAAAKLAVTHIASALEGRKRG